VEGFALVLGLGLAEDEGGGGGGAMDAVVVGAGGK